LETYPTSLSDQVDNGKKTPEINVVKVHLINNFVLTERQDRQLILARVSRYAARPKVKP